jgi:hypothetical protein
MWVHHHLGFGAKLLELCFIEGGHVLTDRFDGHHRVTPLAWPLRVQRLSDAVQRDLVEGIEVYL